MTIDSNPLKLWVHRAPKGAELGRFRMTTGEVVDVLHVYLLRGRKLYELRVVIPTERLDAGRSYLLTAREFEANRAVSPTVH